MGLTRQQKLDKVYIKAIETQRKQYQEDAIKALQWLVADFDKIEKNNIKTYLSRILTQLTYHNN